MIHAPAVRPNGFKWCCMTSGRFDGAERKHYFQGQKLNRTSRMQPARLSIFWAFRLAKIRNSTFWMKCRLTSACYRKNVGVYFMHFFDCTFLEITSWQQLRSNPCRLHKFRLIPHHHRHESYKSCAVFSIFLSAGQPAVAARTAKLKPSKVFIPSLAGCSPARLLSRPPLRWHGEMPRRVLDHLRGAEQCCFVEGLAD